MAKKDPRRFFKKREEIKENAGSARVSEPVMPDLPQNSKEIPASKFYSFVKFGIYACILFGVLSILIFTFTLPPVRESSPSYSLIYYPAEPKGHLNYLEWLITHYRLEDARRELGHLSASGMTDKKDDFDSSRYEELVAAMRTSEEDFRLIVEEYAFWHSALTIFPAYRDGLYRSSQLAYMLFNQDEAASKLRESVDLDPQFLQGRKVLEQIQNEDP
jgi:hypothetical protein